MRKITIFIMTAILSLVFVASVSAIDPSTQQTRKLYVQVVPPLGYRYYVEVPVPTPVEPRAMPYPVKPNFRTPMRDSLWYELYNLRLHRYNSIGRHLGLPPVYPGYRTENSKN